MRSQDDLPPRDQRTLRGWTASILIAYSLLLFVLLGFAMGHTPVSQWISEAVQAEFAVTEMATVGSTKPAQPPEQLRTAKVN